MTTAKPLPSSAAANSAEVLYETERTRVSRVPHSDGVRSLILKEPLGQRAQQRIRHELRILRRLEGVPGVVRLARARRADEILFDDTHGTALGATIHDERLSFSACLTFAVELTNTVAAVHRAGVVHKDINPANVMLCGPLRQPVLIDFDIASTFNEKHPSFTHHRDIVGTLPYLAPEQTGRTGAAVDARADLYSLGATFYELLTGRPPFMIGDPLRMVREVMATVPLSPVELDPQIPQPLSDMIMRLLEKEPDRRYQSAEGLAHDLSRLREELAEGRHEAFGLGERDFPLTLPAPSRLMGREVEVEALRASFEAALEGGGRGVLVAGAPGVGKTTLINVLRPMAAARGGWFVTGKFDKHRQDAESDAIRQTMRALGRLLLAGDEDELEEARVRIKSALGSNSALAATIPELAILLDATPEADPVHPVAGDARAAVTRLHRVFLDFLGAVASPKRPVVIVIDDLQWAGGASVGFIDAVLSDEKLTGVLLVGAYRDGEVTAVHPLSSALARWEALAAGTTTLRLDNLAPTAQRELLGDMLRLPPDEAAKLAVVVGARSDGNPYDTLELVNALRRDGALALGPQGWSWDADTVRRFVGEGDVVDLLKARIDRLPGASRELLEIMACLGGELELELAQVAAGRTRETMEEELIAPLEDGLLVLGDGDVPSVRFRHDRVQQAAHARLEATRRRRLQLAAARRLAATPRFVAIAADQYLQSVDDLRDPQERRTAAGLFVDAAALLNVRNQVAAERFLTAAMALLQPALTAADDPLLAAAERQLHAVRYGLGRLEEADALYASIERRNPDPVTLAGPACVQVASLVNRGESRAAVELGLGMLARLGVDAPGPDFAAGLAQSGDDLAAWSSTLVLEEDLARPESGDERVRLAAMVIDRVLPASVFSEPVVAIWLVQAVQRLWAKHGPSAPLVASLSRSTVSNILLRQDYRTGAALARHALAVGEARAYEPETSCARHVVALMARHWADPFEDSIVEAQRAREGLLRGGDLQMACFTYQTSLSALFDCAPTLASAAADADSALAFAARTGNDHASGIYLGYKQLVQALSEGTDASGAVDDSSCVGSDHPPRRDASGMAGGYFHVHRALAAALLGDSASLITHSAAATGLLPSITAFYPAALAHLCRGLALAEQVRTAAPTEHPELLAELDVCQAWLAARATDAPANFGHLATLLAAERAWAVGDTLQAAQTFDAARSEVAGRRRPWQQALITERAALFHIAAGLVQTGRDLLHDAKRQYAAWGATAKTRQLDDAHAFLRPVVSHQPGFATSHVSTTLSSGISGNELDLLAILHASQALSSETSVEGMRVRLGKVLASMTGATTVLIAMRPDQSDEWRVWGTTGGAADGLPIESAAASRLMPMSAFRYAERTGEPLVIEDATRDDRFARDPYLSGLDGCSLMVVPILSRGLPRAVLMLENRLSRAAFAAERLDAVMLVTGQLTVSLDNAALYASLERKVDERTAALEEANAKLEALTNTDALTGLHNRRSFDARLQAEWRRAIRQGTPLGLAMIDIDEFKRYNDRYGHIAGDRCLRVLGQAFGSELRQDIDVVCRYGGEEFAIILPATDEATSLMLAERVRRTVAGLREPHGATDRGIMSVSIGVAARIPDASGTPGDLVAAADGALYEAKESGRDQVRVLESSPLVTVN